MLAGPEPFVGLRVLVRGQQVARSSESSSYVRRIKEMGPTP